MDQLPLVDVIRTSKNYGVCERLSNILVAMITTQGERSCILCGVRAGAEEIAFQSYHQCSTLIFIYMLL